MLITLTKSILGVDKVQSTDEFFDLGANSMDALRLVTAMEEHGLVVDIEQLLDSPSLADLATHCRPRS